MTISLPSFENGAGQGSRNYRGVTLNQRQLPVASGWQNVRMNVAEYPVLYPNTFFGIHADQLFIMYLKPIAADLTEEHVRIFYIDEGAVDEQYRPHRQHLIDAWRAVFSEDIFAVQGMQKGRASPGFNGGVFSPSITEKRP